MKVTQKSIRDSIKIGCTSEGLCRKFDLSSEDELANIIQIMYPNKRAQKSITSMINKNDKFAKRTLNRKRKTELDTEEVNLQEEDVMEAIEDETPEIPETPEEHLEALNQKESELSSAIADCEALYYEHRKAYTDCKVKLGQVLEKLNALKVELDEQRSVFIELKAEADKLAERANGYSAKRTTLTAELNQVRAEISELTRITVIASHDTIISEVDLDYAGYEELYKNILIQLDPDEFSGVSISQVRVVAQLICASRNSVDREVYVEFDNPEATQLFEKFK